MNVRLILAPIVAAGLALTACTTTTTDQAPLTSYNSSSIMGAAPLTYINSPANGATFPAGKTITITAGANSFNGVNRVMFLVNGEAIATDYRFPYKTRYTLPAPGKYVIHTVAYGVFGASKSSEGVVITAN